MRLPSRYIAVALAVWAAAPPAAGDPAGFVSLVLGAATAERAGDELLVRCEARLVNGTGRDLAVRSNFASAFDGLEVVVTDPDGRVLARQPYTFHQSPYTPDGRAFRVPAGETTGTLVFPVRGLPAAVKAVKVRLVGTLPGSGYDRTLSTETKAVTVRR